MARKNKADNAGTKIADLLINEYHPTSFKEASDLLKQAMAPILESMLKAEMDNHLGYDSNDKGHKETANRRNGYTSKKVKTTSGEFEIDVPRDREGTFEPQIVPKRQRDISEIEDKVWTMYANGMSVRDISSIIEDIYGFSISAEMVSQITDRVLPVVDEWRNRPLKPCYPFVFVDCLYVSVKTDRGARQKAVYVVLGYDAEGHKDILGLWISESESKHFWMEIFDQLKARGVEDIFFLCMDGVSGLEAGARAVFPNVTTQRCIVHLVRNSLKYVSSKDRSAFCRDIKLAYGAINAKEAEKAFEVFKQNWSKYPGAVSVWERHFDQVLQLFEYGSAVRKVMYTTNALESVNSSLRKVTKKGSFPNEDSVYKALYLRVNELSKKWENRTVPNWANVCNQLMCDENLEKRLLKYLN